MSCYSFQTVRGYFSQKCVDVYYHLGDVTEPEGERHRFYSAFRM